MMLIFSSMIIFILKGKGKDTKDSLTMLREFILETFNLFENKVVSPNSTLSS